MPRFCQRFLDYIDHCVFAVTAGNDTRGGADLSAGEILAGVVSLLIRETDATLSDKSGSDKAKRSKSLLYEFRIKQIPSLAVIVTWEIPAISADFKLVMFWQKAEVCFGGNA